MTLRTKPQLADVIEERGADARLNGRDVGVGTVTGDALGRSIKPKIIAGSVTDLRPGTVALHEDEAKGFGVGVGRQLTLTHGGRAVPLRVVAVFTGPDPGHHDQRVRLRPHLRHQGRLGGVRHGQEGRFHGRLPPRDQRRHQGVPDGGQRRRREGPVHQGAEPDVPAGGRAARRRPSAPASAGPR
jgi:hypothetical protein